MAAHTPLEALAVGQFRRLPPSLHERLFPHLAKEDVTRMGTHGDGSCLFHALASALNFKGYLTLGKAQRQRLGQSFRCAFQDHMNRGAWQELQASHPHNMLRSFEEVKSGFCKPAEWAEETMIKYVSKILGLNIVFLSGNTGEFHCTVAGEPSKQDSVVVLWVDNSHFEPILFARKRCKDHLHVRGRLSPTNPADTATISHIAEHFMSSCRPSLPAPSRASFEEQVQKHRHEGNGCDADLEGARRRAAGARRVAVAGGGAAAAAPALIDVVLF